MAKKSASWNKIFINLLMVIPSIFNIACHLVSCVEQEARLAKRSLIALAVLFIIAVALTVGIWLCVCAMAFLWLQSWFSALTALAVLLVSHIVFLFIVGILMARAKEKLLFNNTRQLFH